jgi:NADPH oxidase 2
MAEEPEKLPDFPDDRASVFTETTATSERARWPPLTRMLMSGEMSGEPPRDLTLKEKIDVWMVNEGYRRLFVVVFALLQLMVFAFAFLNFDLKDNLVGARTTFGITYPIARAAALVLHLDVALLLFRTYSLAGQL